MGLNLDLRGEKPTTNGMVFLFALIGNLSGTKVFRSLVFLS
jgi:hypothetical protein